MTIDSTALVKDDFVFVNGIKLIKQQSLWRMQNDFMGGVCVSYVFQGSTELDPFIIYTYIYSPGEPKKISLIQLEAIIRTLTLKKYN